MKRTWLLLLLFCPGLLQAQKKTIAELMRMPPLSSIYCCGDLQARDTIIDNAKGYYELPLPVAPSDSILLPPIRQARQYRNRDGSSLLLVSDQAPDEQCTFYRLYCFEYRPGKDSLVTVAFNELLPQLDYRKILVDSAVVKLLATYLDTVKAAYLGSDGDLDQLVREIYSLHFILPVSGNTLQAEVSVCDYIPLNQVDFAPKDWAVIEKQTQHKLKLTYDRKKKCFRAAGG